MEPQDLHESREADAGVDETSTNGTEPVAANEADDSTIVLPVIVVSKEADASEGTTVGPSIAGDEVSDREPSLASRERSVEPITDALPSDVRRLLDQLRPRRTLELPLPPDRIATEANREWQSLSPAFDDLGRAQGMIGVQPAKPQGRMSHAIAQPGDVAAPRKLPFDPRQQDERAIQKLSAPAASSASEAPFEQSARGPVVRAGIGQPEETSGDDILRGPPVQIVVNLTNDRAKFEAIIDEALRRNAPAYREIARAEVEHAFWSYECKRRAADPSLRGPV